MILHLFRFSQSRVTVKRRYRWLNAARRGIRGVSAKPELGAYVEISIPDAAANKTRQ